jgi:hypothetical protein
MKRNFAEHPKPLRWQSLDILKNKYDWLAEIIKNIELISAGNKVQNIYMCKNDEYMDFMVSKI